MTIADMIFITYVLIAMNVAASYSVLSYVSWSICKTSRFYRISDTLPKRHIIRMLLECTWADWREHWGDEDTLVFFCCALLFSILWPLYLAVVVINIIRYNVALHFDVNKYLGELIHKMVVVLSPEKKKKKEEM